MKTPILSIRALQLSLAREFSELQQKRNSLYHKARNHEATIKVFNPNGMDVKNEWFNDVNENVIRMIEMNNQLARLKKYREDLSKLAKAI